MVVSAGPYRFVNRACGARLIQYIKVDVGKTSPANSTRLRSGKSGLRSAPNLAIRFSAAGTDDHWVRRESRMKSASFCGSGFSSGGTRWSSAPLHRVPKMSNVDTSYRSGEWLEMRSAFVIPKYFSCP